MNKRQIWFTLCGLIPVCGKYDIRVTYRNRTEIKVQNENCVNRHHAQSDVRF